MSDAAVGVGKDEIQGFEPVAATSQAFNTDDSGRLPIQLSRTWIQRDSGFGEYVLVRVEAEGFVRSDIYYIPLVLAAAGEVRIELEHGEVVLEGQAFDVRVRPSTRVGSRSLRSMRPSGSGPTDCCEAVGTRCGNACRQTGTTA